MTNAEEQKREMENEIKKLHTSFEKLRIEYDDLEKKNMAVLLDNKQLEDQLREEKFLTQEAEEVCVFIHRKRHIVCPPSVFLLPFIIIMNTVFELAIVMCTV